MTELMMMIALTAKLKQFIRARLHEKVKNAFQKSF